jgi:hypothetical protein
MKNIKGFAVASDGNMKRIAITYDELDDSGKVINSNVKVNRLITDSDAISAITTIESYVQTVIDEQ